ncbi:MAG: NAD(P)-binding protein [Lysobacterales bacterium]
MPVKRIAIVGGGPAGLSTAFHLTEEPDWQDKYDICIYQMGWRVGGKGATGRDDENGWRILEHGIHGFCSCYFNTWAMMKKAYSGLEPSNRKVLPNATIGKAFLPSSMTYQLEHQEGHWHDEVQSMPGIPGKPWMGPAPEMNWHGLMKGILAEMLKRGRTSDMGRLSPADLVHPEIPNKTRKKKHKALGTLLHGALKMLHNEVHKLEGRAIEEFMMFAADHLDGLRKHLQDLAEELERKFHHNHSLAISNLDLYWTVMKGIVDERLWEKDLNDLDDEDFRDWLKRHGALDHTLRCAMTFVVPNIMFSYPGGDSTNPPQMSTASWLGWILRSLLGQGDYFYFMAAGTGESVIAPLYLALKQRGVRFEFFHKLTSIETDDEQGKTIQKLHFQRQLKLKQGTYEPLQKVPGKPWQVWPSHPLWEQTKFADQNQGIDFEKWYQPDGAGASERTLTRGGRGKDSFDYVVWAMPPSMIKHLAPDTLAKSWSRTAAAMSTTATQASQIWLTHSTEKLGWKVDRKKYGRSARYISGSFPNPLNCMAVFDDLISAENWGADAPKGLIYFCSQMHHVDQTHPGDLGRTMAHTSATLRVLGNFLRDSVPDDKMRNDPQAMDFNYLWVPKSQGRRRGEARLKLQYHRANTDPTDAYVQALPGTAKQRLMPWDSGYTNLVPAGDWIYTGVNAGAFESAVTGGKFAAMALTGYLDKEQVYGIDFLNPSVTRKIQRAVGRGAVPVIK